ncbi:RAM signaling network component [Komagataella phaffii CBS 7435]|uniref:Component of the RAM signaling network n=2 Tax=Komagataella phaffii TaxID=460519 RepID=C4R467_KOMPG|nr:Component of the RAM signaling network [Komagataella phaffii GS115]AOA63366.1 GQ67_03373T0 [Komagataella phaffii]KAI0463965.1 hypothetical protein LJB42_002975 [Komagataella kurtzmanii]CAH2449900.1 RAM signaling network component [Komagataella phaffii CBS 7435]AOA68478.1 GQ68_03342T0 [Komagataella phaffii GS115]CAY70353.1 Component of the RAM signaling network [Komagataella phaffii GS115]
MAFLFKRNPKAQELVRNLNDSLTKLESYPTDNSNRKKVVADISKNLSQIKIILQGKIDNYEELDDENDDRLDMADSPSDYTDRVGSNTADLSIPGLAGSNVGSPETDSTIDQISQLANECYITDLLYRLLLNIETLEFNSRKDVYILCTSLLRREIGNRSPTIDYLLTHDYVIQLLMKAPEYHSNINILLSNILRECIKFEKVCRYCLNSELFWQYFKYSQQSSFENSTDALITLNDLLANHHGLVQEFFSKQSNLDRFIENINKLITCNNYVTKRQSIKLLSKLILQRSNYNLMTDYVNNSSNLKLIMINLSDKSKNLQYESFQVFKVFVANPKKNRQILDILIKNREKLLFFLKEFNYNDKDTVFNEEKEFLIQQIEELPSKNNST